MKKQIIVNVHNLSEEEKLRINDALEKITGAAKIPAIYISPEFGQFFALSTADSTADSMMITWVHKDQMQEPTHTPQQVLEMAGMEKQGHIHADLMAQYAEDAKTTAHPWRLWQYRIGSSEWTICISHPEWGTTSEYRRKPKTKLIHGVEVPDISFIPENGENYFSPSIDFPDLYDADYFEHGFWRDELRMKDNRCYPYTDEGREAAILHAKAMLSIC